MPPYVPRKRFSDEDPPPAKHQRRARTDNAKSSDTIPDSDADSDADSDSSLSEVPEEDNTPQAPTAIAATDDSDEEYGDDDEVDWEDAIGPDTMSATTPSLAVPEIKDLELTLEKNESHAPETLDSKKGPSKIERHIRIQTHCMHVQCLLFHNTIRNSWVNDAEVHKTLRDKLSIPVQNEVKRWRIASGLEKPEPKPEPPKKRKKGKAPKTQDWAEDSERLEPGQPDMSRGDPILSLLKVLAAYWEDRFDITAPGLRKQGYRPVSSLEAILNQFKEESDPELHGERIADIDEFRASAKNMKGSRDLGAQLFTALIRALGIEARLVASLQPLGFGWTKAEIHTPPKVKEEPRAEPGSGSGSDSEVDSMSEYKIVTKSQRKKSYDGDMPFPIYWTEVASPITNEIISVDPLVLKNPIAPTPEQKATFEPRGIKADRAKQVICYVVAHSADGTAKDVTTRYLRRQTWPSKTKGFRIPVDKIAIPGKRGKYIEFDWFRVTMRRYERDPSKRTQVDEIEDAKDLQRKQPEKKKSTQTGDTLTTLRTSTEFVLERFLRREEALKPGAEPVRTFVAGKGARAKEESVYLRADVVKCLSAESWHKEGRQIQTGAVPLKRVPIRAVTLVRKRAVEEMQRETGEKPMQGLYSVDQTEYIIPPPIQDGVIPKNNYGNMDCFVPSMVPQGAAHVPLPGTVRVCKKLGIDYAEAVTGFEFGSKMAVPVIQGVVVAAENEGLLRDAWKVETAEKHKREKLKAEKLVFQTWRKILFGLRIAERVREEYGGQDGDEEKDARNPFSSHKTKTQEENSHTAYQEKESHDPADYGGGFLLPGEGEDDVVDHGGGFLLPGEGEDEHEEGDLIVEHNSFEKRGNASRAGPAHMIEVGDSDEALSPPVSVSSPSDNDIADSESDYAPLPRNPHRRRRGG
ncbi:hypothetical protein N7495_000368 [Penicillium taxi]|uniref:uncharacterized protein n=1 Tax=Penicillium taxi TaxID=168475 RepID=UPI002544D728|nr:uncharacterized protein N7495_000368 [Penicillium taxi]KAJ5907686.1 hypothetical protein N7495_000368 [Penicillium taxi]